VQIVVLSGPSGSGKTTVVQHLLEISPIKLVKAISATTRPPRKGEVEGHDYYFLTPAQFHELRERQQFVECCEVHGTGNWYGTLKSELQRAVSEGGWALLEIDVQGARRILEQYPDALTIFLRTSSIDEYERRLRSRGTESEASIERRVANAREELESADTYQYQVINDDLSQAVRDIADILSKREAEIHAR
jgi:guanylate kinase